MKPPDAETAAPVDRKYRLLTVLGEGATGVVHLAVSRGPGGFLKLAVLKLLRRELLFEPLSRQMFMEEARICARLAHPNLVTVFEVTEHEGQPAIVMEYLEGQPLSAMGREDGPRLPLELHLYVLSEMLAGLHAAHELQDFDGTPMGLVHRDVSPHNVFLQFDGQVKVLDFGIAKARRSTVRTDTGLLKGKIRYMAPEQLLGEAIDRRADVFAVGAMLHEALSGAPLWGDLGDGEVLRMLANETVPPLPPGCDAPASLVELRDGALAARPEERIPTAAALREGLEAYLRDHGPRPAAADLGRCLLASFGEARAQRRELVEAQLREVQVSGDFSSDAAPREEASVPPPSGPHRPAWSRAARYATSLMVGAGLSWAAFALVTTTNERRRGARASAVEEEVASACPAHTKACDGGCVAHDRPSFGCAAPGCAPCNLANATARCDAEDQCAIAICYQGWGDCDGDASNGCEIDTRTDPDHCGSCGARCPEVPHGERGCGDVCTIWRCDAGFRDCNGLVRDGCETAVDEDPAHCGACDRACGPNETCEGGACGSGAP